jgi:hypothetical protein
MYINNSYSITNTPSVIKAGYNTWPYLPPKNDWYQHTTRFYIDHNGNVQAWNHWNPPQLLNVQGGQYKGTPTRTGGFYAQNTIINPNGAQYLGPPCGY